MSSVTVYYDLHGIHGGKDLPRDDDARLDHATRSLMAWTPAHRRGKLIPCTIKPNG